MIRLQIAIIGFGKIGQACARAIRAAQDMVLAGVVRRPENALNPLPAPFSEVPVVTHIREIERVDAALVCVPTERVLGVAGELLQARIPIVECASLEGNALERHYEELSRLAQNHRTRAMVGAGWKPGALSLFERLFEVLIPKGHTKITCRPGLSLHHTAAVESLPGVKEALCTELKDTNGKLQRYVYVELDKGVEPGEITSRICSDPLFLGEETMIFPVDDLSGLEEEHGLVMERVGSADQCPHQSLLLEARFDVAAFTARVMLDAARSMPRLRPGAHVYALLC